MHIALAGSHGVGKTTVFDLLRERRPDAAYFSEAVRHQMPAFGIGHPIDDVCRIYGIGAFELFNMNAWSVIDPAVNTLLTESRLIVTDRSAVDSYAYYLAMRETSVDALLEPLVRAIARHYASLIDLYVHFPIGIFPLHGDDMRPADDSFQREIDKCFVEALDILGVPKTRVHTLCATDPIDRANEVLSFMRGK